MLKRSLHHHVLYGGKGAMQDDLYGVDELELELELHFNLERCLVICRA